jgi:hypothetical protein
MKTLLYTFLFLTCSFVVAQQVDRVVIKGNIVVEGNDLEGITVYNSTTNKGAVTDVFGNFTITAAKDDLLQIRSLNYQNFDIFITAEIIKSQRMRVFLIEEIEKLEEVVVATKLLTGNIKSDIPIAAGKSLNSSILYFGKKSKNSIEFGNENKKQIDDIAVQSNAKSMVTGLNLINVVDQLLIPLFRSEVEDKKKAGIPEVPVKTIKYYFASTFLVENFNIPPHRVEEFVRYVEDETFNFDYLNYGNEMEFLQLLSEKSKAFLTK